MNDASTHHLSNRAFGNKLRFSLLHAEIVQVCHNNYQERSLQCLLFCTHACSWQKVNLKFSTNEKDLKTLHEVLFKIAAKIHRLSASGKCVIPYHLSIENQTIATTKILLYLVIKHCRFIYLCFSMDFKNKYKHSNC